MSKNYENIQDMEKELSTFYRKPNPSPEFMKNFAVELNQELESKNPPLPKFLREKNKIGFLPAWAALPTLIFLLILGVVFIVGPETAYAQVRSWLGYIPGIGHVNTEEEFRVLEEPLRLTKEGITVELSKVVANNEYTYILIKKEGLPAFTELFAGVDTQNVEITTDLWQTDARILLPDGTTLSETMYTGGVDEGCWEFPALPEGVSSFTLEIGRLPAIPEGEAPENWVFNVQLAYAVNAEDLPEFQNSYPDLPALVVEEPQTLEETTTEVKIAEFELSVDVINVVYSDTETALQLQINDLPDGWQVFEGSVSANLSDDLGNTYEMIRDNWNLNPTERYDTFTLTFGTLSDQAKQLYLEVTRMNFMLYFDDQYVEIDLTEAPTADFYYPMDSTLNVLSVPVHFSGVYLQEKTDSDGFEVANLDFVIDPIPIVNGISVLNIIASDESAAAFGGEFKNAGGGGGGGMLDNGESGFSQITLSFNVTIPDGLPQNSVKIPLDTAFISYAGSLKLDWEITATE